ncbi:LacI family DNA-binding transcriptional regulator [Serinibacter arcticus]|uniref:LacI family DNA-binding transcriptional regulator n=1 Tax=Serinibacter arcticus TaxID=1655435 RepID=UPI001F22BA96|nr:LacI family DNA-binding transcriptional regulator [Serinibacter arcticus]
MAAAAGVSRGTVSRVINGGHWVSPPAREAVEQAIATTGYRANQHARSLVTGRSNSLAFLITEPQSRLFADPVFSMLLRGAAEAVSARSMALVVLVAGTPSERENAAQYIGAGHVDGVLLISSHESDPMVQLLLEQDIPTVACGMPLGFAGRVPSVSVEEAGSARTVVAHLRERGRRRIAMITGPMDTPGGRYRLEGYRDELGDDFDDSLVVHGDWSQDSGTAGMEELLARHPDLDAVFAGSDLMAAGAIIALGRAGRSIPDDVAVVGFDDSGLAQALDPPLTTMRQPFDAISVEMVNTLVGLVEGGGTRSVTLPATLVVREST